MWGCIGDVHRKHRQAPSLFDFIVKIMYTSHITYDQRNAFCKTILLQNGQLEDWIFWQEGRKLVYLAPVRHRLCLLTKSRARRVDRLADRLFTTKTKGGKWVLGNEIKRFFDSLLVTRTPTFFLVFVVGCARNRCRGVAKWARWVLCRFLHMFIMPRFSFTDHLLLPYSEEKGGISDLAKGIRFFQLV